MYPNDDQFKEVLIEKVDGNSVTFDDGWSFFVPEDSPVKPAVGMSARLYGKGIGSPVRGLFLDGQKVYYFTAPEYAEKQDIELYGASPADWLERWDAGRSVWSIEMGGLGPGYEQCIHITAAEILRHLIAEGYDWSKWEDGNVWKRDIAKIEDHGFKNPVVEKLGLSGAQWGAAVNLACNIFRMGPRGLMNDPRVKNRKIQVRRTFPVAA